MLGITHRRYVLACCVATLTAAAWPVAAQTPDRPIRLVVGYPPGGASDVVARMLGQEMASELRQSVVVENRPGAGGTIGGAEVAKSAKDGSSLFFGDTGSLILSKAIYKSMPFDPDRDLVPVGFAAESAFFLVVHKDFPARTLAEFLAQAKARPGALSYASPGNGSPHHIAMEVLKQRAKVDVLHVPYKGAAPAVTDLLGGQIPMMVLDPAATIAQSKAGKIRALAILAPRRMAELPDVPTNAEAGLPDVEASNIWAVMAPRGTPEPVIQTLNGALRKAAGTPSIVQRLGEMGLSARTSSPDELARYLEQENGSTREFVRKLQLDLN
ncbi:MAG: Bug family tripartite tricarboxylate transporter substrate binding protein [Lautropia sp.]